MTQTTRRQIRFGPFVLDTPNARLLRDGQAVALTPKAYDVLHYLAERSDRLVTKEELLGAVWSDVVVSEASIKVCVREIRRALGDDAARPTFIQTIHRRGYRFIAMEVDGFPATDAFAASADASQEDGRTPAGGWATGGSADGSLFVGRDTELARLKSAASAATGGERQVVFVGGGPGCGKTSVVRALLAAVAHWQIGTAATVGTSASPASMSALAPAEPVVLVGHCFEQYGTSEPYMPLWEAIAPLAEIDRPAAAMLRNLLSRHEAAHTTPDLPPAAVAGVPRAMSERLRRDMIDALEELSRGSSLVVMVLEDLHWADYSTLDLLSTLARRRSPARLLLVATYRPVDAGHEPHPLRDVIATLLSARLASDLQIEPLTLPEVSRYLGERFSPHADFPAALARRLHDRTGGHPLFLAHLVDDLLEQHLIVRSADGAWTMGGDKSVSTLDGLPPEMERCVPRSVRAMVEGQLTRLSAGERQAIEAAAVAGVDFSAAAVAAILGSRSPAALTAPAFAAEPVAAATAPTATATASFDAVVAAEDACEALSQRHRFLVPAGEADWPDGSIATRYRFTHELYHNVVYSLIPAARKARMHLALGERMEAAWQDRAAEIAAELAVHFEQGRSWARAAHHLQTAADAAIRHYAHREAVTYLRRALAALDRLPPDQRAPRELNVLMSLGVNLQVTRGFGSPRVQEVHARAYALCRNYAAGETAGTEQSVGTEQYAGTGRDSSAEADPTFRVVWGIWVFHKVRSDLKKALEMATHLMSRARRAGDPVLLLQAHQAMCVTSLCLGDFARAVEHTEAAADIHRDEGDARGTRLFGQDPCVAIAAFGSVAYQFLGRSVEARAASEASLALAGRLGQPSTLAVALHFAAMYHQGSGDPGRTEHFAREAIALAVEERFSFWHAGARVLIGWAIAARGNAGGIAEIRKGIAAWLATGSRTYHTYYLGLLADACLHHGMTDDAKLAAEEALALANELDEGIYLKQLHALRDRANA